MLDHEALCDIACLPPPSVGEVTTGGHAPSPPSQVVVKRRGFVVLHPCRRLCCAHIPCLVGSGPWGHQQTLSTTSELQASPHTAQQSNLGLYCHDKSYEKHHWVIFLLDECLWWIAFKYRPLSLVLAKAASMHIAGLGLNPLTSSCHDLVATGSPGDRITGLFPSMARGNAPPIWVPGDCSPCLWEQGPALQSLSPPSSSCEAASPAAPQQVDGFLCTAQIWKVIPIALSKPLPLTAKTKTFKKFIFTHVK